MQAETNGNEDAMNKAGLLFLVAALLVGCTPQGPAATQTAIPATVITAPPIATPSPPATPTTMPIPATVATATATAVATTIPEVTAIPIDQSDIRCTTAEDTGDIPQEIGEVIDQLGFALQPSVLPDGFQLAGVSSNNNEIRQIYQSASNNIIIAYPLEFSPDATSGPLGWERPEDAVNSLKIGDQTVYLMKGGCRTPVSSRGRHSVQTRRSGTTRSLWRYSSHAAQTMGGMLTWRYRRCQGRSIGLTPFRL